MIRKRYWGLVLGGCLLALPLYAQEQVTDDFQVLEEAKTEVPSFQLNYTWNDFLVGQDCKNDFDQLKALPFLSESQQQLKDKMQTYCVKPIIVWDVLLSLFRQNKKALLIDKILKENTIFFGYIKVLPYYLFDVHNTQSKGTDLFSKLDQIQDSIQNKNPEGIIMKMQDLSPNEQLFFNTLFNEANNLIDFKKALSESEGHND